MHILDDLSSKQSKPENLRHRASRQTQAGGHEQPRCYEILRIIEWKTIGSCFLKM